MNSIPLWRCRWLTCPQRMPPIGRRPPCWQVANSGSRAVLRSLEPRFRVGVVVRYAWPGEGPAHQSRCDGRIFTFNGLFKREPHTRLAGDLICYQYLCVQTPLPSLIEMCAVWGLGRLVLILEAQGEACEICFAARKVRCGLCAH